MFIERILCAKPYAKCFQVHYLTWSSQQFLEVDTIMMSIRDKGTNLRVAAIGQDAKTRLFGT